MVDAICRATLSWSNSVSFRNEPVALDVHDRTSSDTSRQRGCRR
jgi:hypothetical protein